MAPRWIALLTLAVCALAVAGCGDKESVTLHGDTEGTFVDVGPLQYQVQISRLLNPHSAEDKGYLIDLPASQRLGPKDQWFAVFMLVQNNGDKPQRSADDYVIRDTQDNEFRPIAMGTKNVFAYRQGAPVPPGGRLPLPDSPPGQNSIQGSMLLFKIPNADLDNRPLELAISSSVVPNTTATVDLDV